MGNVVARSIYVVDKFSFARAERAMVERKPHSFSGIEQLSGRAISVTGLVKSATDRGIQHPLGRRYQVIVETAAD